MCLRLDNAKSELKFDFCESIFGNAGRFGRVHHTQLWYPAPLLPLS